MLDQPRDIIRVEEYIRIYPKEILKTIGDSLRSHNASHPCDIRVSEYTIYAIALGFQFSKTLVASRFYMGRNRH